MKKYLLLTLIGCAYGAGLLAQISYGGTPPSFNSTSINLRSSKAPSQLDLRDVDVEQLKYEDRIAEGNGSPFRIAVSIPVDVDINKTGEWVKLSDSQLIWKQTVVADNAIGLIVSYKDFYIPEGAQLFIYNKDRSQLLGAYTHETNPKGGKFSNEIINGDELTFEYVASNISDEQPRLAVKSIGYMYDKSDESDLDTRASYIYAPHVGDSPSCMINVNCTQGDNWQNQKRGVVHMAMEITNGWYMCSGSLINNTKQDATPYVLSAYHCFDLEYTVTDKEGKKTTFNEKAFPDTWQFYFNYEFPSCSNQYTVPSGTKSLVGTQVVVELPIYNTSDGVLLKLTNNVPKEWKPYYNGWDVTNTPATSGVVIHHPSGDVKKITTYSKPLTSTYFQGTPVNSFWKVVYSSSVTAGGSSGSPMFNQDGLIVGTLTSGYSYCDASEDGGPNDPDYYGKLWYAWSQSSNVNQRMNKYLDPTNTGLTKLAGYDPNGISGIENAKEKVNYVFFPNPVDAELHINTREIIKSVRIVDMAGRLVYESRNLQSSTVTVPADNWSKGVYNVIVDTDQGKFTDKVVKN